MALLHSNFKAGLLDADPGIGGTTLSSPGFEFLPVVASPDLLWLVLDPDAVNGAPETVLVTAHTASATTVTVIRGQQGDAARAHPINTEWIHSLTKGEADVLPTTILTTKGDVTVATGSNAVARQAVGSDTQLWIADSAQANGVKYGFYQPPLCQLTRTAISFGDNTLTLVPFNSVSHEDLDPFDWHDPATNNARITPDIAGWGQVFCAALPATGTDYANLRLDVEKNGTVVHRLHPAADVGAPTGLVAATPLIQMNGSTDYLQIRFLQNNTANVSRDVTITFLVKLVYPT